MYMQIFRSFILLSILSVASTNLYNYYELAVQKWCSSTYMIHGLWPQINATDYPENCDSVSYTKPSGLLLENMNTYWHACDNTLWEHEWTKHGSCMQAQDKITEDEFFNITLSLFLDNVKLLDKCKNDDCILACFDLEYNRIGCDLE